MRRSAAAIACILVALLLTPAAAFGVTVTSRTVSVQTGPQLVSEALAQLGSVSVGSTGATVTIGTVGHRRPVHVDFGSLADSSKSGSGGTAFGLLELAVLAPLAGGCLRLLTFLARLGAR